MMTKQILRFGEDSSRFRFRFSLKIHHFESFCHAFLDVLLLGAFKDIYLVIGSVGDFTSIYPIGKPALVITAWYPKHPL